MRHARIDKNDENDGRLRLLYLYQLLLKQTDEEHPMSTNEIRRIMEEKHNIYMHRTTVPRDMELLKAAGIEVMRKRSRSWSYYLEDRTFSVAELKILIDAVQSSRFITEKKSKEMIDKLISLTSETNAQKLNRSLHVSRRSKSENEKGYYIVDAINDAIHQNVKISFLYHDFDSKKKLVPKNNGEPYTVSPYDLIWDGDFYYMTGFCDERGEVRVFRVDHITEPPILLEEKQVKKPRGYRVSHYTHEAFRMLVTDESVEVKLLCEKEVMRACIDHFGMKVRTRFIDQDHFQVTVKVCTSSTFYRWVFGWGGKIKIVSPEPVMEEYREMLVKAMGSLEE